MSPLSCIFLKIEDKAKAAGVTPQQFVDNIVCGEKGILDLWKLMNISNDRFIRTTDDYHVEAIQKIFKKMHAVGVLGKLEEVWRRTESYLGDKRRNPESPYQRSSVHFGGTGSPLF